MFPAQEHEQVISFIDRFAPRRGEGAPRVLDVGSGRGRYLDLSARKKWKAVGLEVNPAMVASARERGHEVYQPGQPEITKHRFDVILMSHIVEHFDPDSLLQFLRTYLDLLDNGGILVVATPLLHTDFFEDFDHVKPYGPVGFLMLLSEKKAQLKFQWEGEMKLEDLWYRRSPYRITQCRARYLPRSPFRPFLRISDYAFAALFHLSLGCLGKPTGWVGVFRKVS